MNIVKLKELSINNRGYYGIGAPAINYDKNKFVYLRITDIKDNGEISKDSLMSVEDSKASQYILEKNDIVFARTGASTGRNYFYDGEIQNMVYAGFLIKFSLNSNLVNPRYVKYYCLSPKYKDWIYSSLTGSTRPNINEKQLSEMPIELPERTYQDKVVKILDSITKKIELNNKINNNLLEILKSIYKEKYYIKEENRVSLSTLIKETIGGDWGKEQQEGNYIRNVYCIRGADIPQMVYGNKGSVPSRYILEKNYNNKKLKPNEIIIEISGGSPTQSTGRTAFISEKIIQTFEIPIVCTNFCRAIEFLDEKYAPYVYLHLLCLYDNKIFFNYENGTTGIKNLKLTDLLNKEYISIPSNEELLNFYDLFNALFNKIVENSDENQNLEQLRDILLPKLMNDEIDLENIEI